MRNLFFALAWLLTLSVSSQAAPRSVLIADALEGPYPVTYVYDGDTIEVASREKVRLVMIDTPESSDNQRTSDPLEIELGKKAKAALEGLLDRGGYRVYLERVGVDRYGRTLAYVYVDYQPGTAAWISKDRRAYTSLNYELVSSGWAEAFVLDHDRYLPYYDAAQAKAREALLGVWAAYAQTEREAQGLPVRIKCAVYNPTGPDAGREEIWLEVIRAVDLDGWEVGDDDGLRIPLSGHATPGTLAARIEGRPELSNKGDTILLWRDGEVVDRFTYEGRKGLEKACR